MAVPLAFLALFFVWPVAAIIGRGLGGSGFREVITDGRLRSVVWFSLWQAVASTLITLAVGLPAAFVVGRYEFRGRRLVTAVLTAPFVLPTVVVGAAFLAMLPSSFERSVWAIISAHVFFNIAVVVRTVGGLWSHVDLRLVESARTLGASPWQAAREVTLPLLRPALAAAITLVFLFTFGSFGVVLILGGPTRSTVETEIYRQTAQALRLDRAAALAVLQLVAMTAVLWFAGRWQARRSTAMRRLRVEQRVPVRPVIAAVILCPILSFVAAPIVTMAERALRDPDGSGYSLRSFRTLFETTNALGRSPISTVFTSVRTGVIAAAIACAVGALAAAAIASARGRMGTALDTLLMLPLGTSAVTVGFGFLITFDTAPFDWRSKWFAVPLVQALVGMPFVVRAVLPVLRSIDPKLREAAATLGASPTRVRREIDIPIARRALAVGTGMAFAVSLGEFGATTFLARPETSTMPIAIERLLGRPGTAAAGQAMALALVLALLTGGIMLALESLRDGQAAEL